MIYFFKLPTIINDSWSSMNQNEVFQLEFFPFGRQYPLALIKKKIICHKRVCVRSYWYIFNWRKASTNALVIHHHEKNSQFI